MTFKREDLVARAAKVRLFIFDVDGVLTDGSLSYGAEGEMVKTFNVHDGLGIKLLQEAGIKTAIISARRTPIVLARAKDLGIDYVHQGGHNKLPPFQALLAELGLKEEQVAFIGRRGGPAAAAPRWLCRQCAERPQGSAATRPLHHRGVGWPRRGARGLRIRAACKRQLRSRHGPVPGVRSQQCVTRGPPTASACRSA
jgi:hypothetical protein